MQISHFQLCIQNKKLTTTVLAILRLPHILTLITFLTNVFTTVISWYFVFFVISRCTFPAANFRILESFGMKRRLKWEISQYVYNQRNTTWKVLVVFVSEISLVRCAHFFEFWYVNNTCVNTVRPALSTICPWLKKLLQKRIDNH